MGGVNGFGPGPMRGAFSVVAVSVTITVTVTVFSGAFASWRAQAALNPTIVRIAAAPAVARRRRVKRSDLICSLSFRSGGGSSQRERACSPHPIRHHVTGYLRGPR
jgi:hypothetical protein